MSSMLDSRLLALSLLSFSWSTAFATDEPKYEWIKVTDKAAYAPRDGAGALVFQNQMWLIGGWNPGDKKFFPRICNNEVWSSRNGVEWKLVRPNSFRDRQFDSRQDWEGRHTAGYVVYNKAKKAGLGHELPSDWFTETVHP